MSCSWARAAASRSATPQIDGAKVKGTVTYQGRGKKLIVYKFRRRKNYRRKAGHRQYYTEIKVDSIDA